MILHKKAKYINLNTFIMLFISIILFSNLVYANDQFTPNLGDDVTSLIEGLISFFSTPVSWDDSPMAMWILISFWVFSFFLIYIVLSKAPFFNDVHGLNSQKLKFALSGSIVVALSFGTNLINYWRGLMNFLSYWSGFLFLLVSIQFITTLANRGNHYSKNMRREYVDDEDTITHKAKNVLKRGAKKGYNYAKNLRKDKNKVKRDLSKIFDDVGKYMNYLESLETKSNFLVKAISNKNKMNVDLNEINQLLKSFSSELGKAKKEFKKIIKEADKLFNDISKELNDLEKLTDSYKPDLINAVRKKLKDVGNQSEVDRIDALRKDYQIHKKVFNNFNKDISKLKPDIDKLNNFLKEFSKAYNGIKSNLNKLSRSKNNGHLENQLVSNLKFIINYSSAFKNLSSILNRELSNIYNDLEGVNAERLIKEYNSIKNLE